MRLSATFGRALTSRIEPVKIHMPDGSSHISPPLAPRQATASSSYINAATGLTLTREEQSTLLNQMSLDAKPSSTDSDLLDVNVPCTRPDILHECDIMEDAAIAYGFNNLPQKLPNTSTVAKPFAVNRLGDILRKECAMAGWVEALPLILVSFLHYPFRDHQLTFSVLTMKTSPGLTDPTQGITPSNWPTPSLSSIKSSEPLFSPVCSRLPERTDLCLFL